jgi:hypothetical protein
MMTVVVLVVALLHSAFTKITRRKASREIHSHWAASDAYRAIRSFAVVATPREPTFARRISEGFPAPKMSDGLTQQISARVTCRHRRR